MGLRRRSSALRLARHGSERVALAAKRASDVHSSTTTPPPTSPSPLSTLHGHTSSHRLGPREPCRVLHHWTTASGNLPDRD